MTTSLATPSLAVAAPLFFLFVFLTTEGYAQKQPASQNWTPRILKPVFQPGKIYRFTADNQFYMAPPGEAPRLILIKQQARYDTTPRTEGKGVALRGRTEKLEIKIQSGPDQLTYDSLKKESQQTAFGRHFESTVNRYVDLELNEAMKILAQKEGGKAGAATPLPGLPRFGPEELVQIVSLLPQGFSPEAVNIGDEWVLKGKRNVGELGQFGFEVIYKLAGLAEYDRIPCVALEFRGYLSGDITGESSRAISFQDSQINGRILFDPELQMTRYSESEVYMTVNIPGKGNGERRPVPIQQKAALSLLSVK